MPTSGNASMGDEYANIAESLVMGHGYGDSFGPGSGPTAWMPPALTGMIAVVFFLCGIKSYTALWVLLMLNCMALAGSFYWLVRAMNGWLTSRGRLYFGLIYIVLLTIQAHLFLTGLTDFTYLLLLSALIVHAVLQTTLNGWCKLRIHWFLLAVLVPLSNPCLCLCFGGGLIIALASHEYKTANNLLGIFQRPIWYFLITLALSLVSLGCWTGRNYMVFHKFIPLKSNAGYETYLAQVVSKDGVLSNQIFLSSHPFAPGKIQDEFFSLGEIAFVEKYQIQALSAIKANPEEYLRRVGHRLLNACFFTKPGHDAIGTRYNFQIVDRIKLTQERLIYQVPPSMVTAWISLDWDPVVFKQKLENLGISDIEGVYQEWKVKRSYWNEQVFTPLTILSGFMMAGIPVLAMFVVIVRRRMTFPTICASMMIFLYLFPYILVSHYFRYQLPLLGLQAIIIFYAFAHKSLSLARQGEPD